MMYGALEVKNVPEAVENSFEDGFVVVRRCDDGGKVELWYYGIYTDREKAYEVAYEIGNGIVLEV